VLAAAVCPTRIGKNTLVDEKIMATGGAMSQQVDYLALSLLDNFDCDQEQVQVSQNLSIVRIDKISDPRVSLVLGEEAIDISRERVGKTRSPAVGTLMPYQIDVGNTVLRKAEFSNHALQWR
jgi:hypothetical protein